jgi:ADP-ribose pyrophosphatase
MAHDPPIRTVASRIAWRCPWFEIRQDDVVLPDGTTAQWNVLVKGDGVWIVPLLPDGRVVLLRAWRHTVQDWCWEIPAGTRKPGASPEETARDELREEAGGTAAELERVGGFYTAFGAMSEVGHVFLARGVTLGEPERERTEVHEVHVVDGETALRWALDGTMTDSNSALALLRCAQAIRDAADAVARAGREGGGSRGPGGAARIPESRR